MLTPLGAVCIGRIFYNHHSHTQVMRDIAIESYYASYNDALRILIFFGWQLVIIMCVVRIWSRPGDPIISGRSRLSVFNSLVKLNSPEVKQGTQVLESMSRCFRMSQFLDVCGPLSYFDSYAIDALGTFLIFGTQSVNTSPLLPLPFRRAHSSCLFTGCVASVEVLGRQGEAQNRRWRRQPLEKGRARLALIV